MNFGSLHLSEPLVYPTGLYVSHWVPIIEVLLYDVNQSHYTYLTLRSSLINKCKQEGLLWVLRVYVYFHEHYTDIIRCTWSIVGRLVSIMPLGIVVRLVSL